MGCASGVNQVRQRTVLLDVVPQPKVGCTTYIPKVYLDNVPVFWYPQDNNYLFVVFHKQNQNS